VFLVTHLGILSVPVWLQDGLLKQLQSSLARVIAEQQVSGKQPPQQQPFQLSDQRLQQLTLQITEQVWCL